MVMAPNPQHGGGSAPKSATVSPALKAQAPIARPRGWWGRNWLRVLLIMVVLPVLAAGGIFFYKVGPVMFSQPYHLAVDEAKLSQQLKDQLGEPLSSGWIPQGSIDQDAGEARLNFVMKGSKPGQALVSANARRTDGKWGFSQFDATLAGGSAADGKRLNLMDDVTARMGVDTPQFDVKTAKTPPVKVEEAPPSANINIEIPTMPDQK